MQCDKCKIRSKGSLTKSRYLLLEFWDPSISETIEARDFKFGIELDDSLTFPQCFDTVGWGYPAEVGALFTTVSSIRVGRVRVTITVMVRVSRVSIMVSVTVRDIVK